MFILTTYEPYIPSLVF